MGSVEEAIFRKAVEDKPDSMSTWKDLSNFLFEQKRYDEAIETLYESVRILPECEELWMVLGGLLFVTGRSVDAIAALEEAIRLYPLDSEQARIERENVQSIIDKIQHEINQEYKSEVGDIINYNGANLNREEAEVLFELEEIMNKPIVIKVPQTIKFPCFTFENNSVTTLELPNKQLYYLPDNIGNLRNLTYLRLNDNNLNSLPDSFSSLTNLEILSLGGNQFEYLPDNISALANLQKLLLGINQLLSLPDSITSMSNLTVLNLTFNHLTSLPKNMDKLVNLNRLSLDFNYMTSLPESTFTEFNNLEESGCKVGSYSHGSLWHQKSID